MKNVRYIPIKIGKILHSKRWAYYLIAAVQVLAFVSGTGVVSANTDCTDPTACTNQDDLYSINSNTPFYDPTDTVCSAQDETVSNATGSSVVVPPGQGTGTWNSGISSADKPILEQFMIELLKDIAKKRGVPASDAVTQQHVIALLAFAKGEGGDMTNNNFWNPFNTGLKADDLTVPGKQSSDGSTEVFKSFDAGVEATARVMTGNTQGRLGVTLTDPNSSATDFLNSLLDFPSSEPAGGYPTGHSPWAEASNPSAGLDKDGKPIYQPDYKKNHLNLISQVTNDYDSEASYVMRAQSSDSSNQHDTSKLTFHTNGSSSSVTVTDASLSTCANTGLASAAGGSFIDKVRAYAWPTYHEGPYCLMVPAYATAIQNALKNGEYVGGGFGGVYESAQVDSKSVPIAAKDNCTASGNRAGIDCGGFVTRVYRDSGADPHYNQNNGTVPAQHNYVESHPSLYKRIYPQQSGDLNPGDIYFEQGDGHTYLFVGNDAFPKDPVTKQVYNAVSASVSYSQYGQSWRTPMASVADDIKGGIWYRPLFSLGTTTNQAL